ncbi:MAG: HAD family phosphatase [Bacteroidota bacterium]
MATIKNIVFDLGNVLLDLHLSKTEEAFRELLQEDFEDAYIKYEADRLFERLEIGKISSFEFVKGMRSATEVPLNDDEIIDGWNALLGDLPQGRLDLIKALSQDYKVYLLSNTNAIHMESLDEYLQENRGISLEDFTNLFEKHYFSYELQLRKPNAAIYKYLIEDAGIDPAETLFIDDREDNTTGAEQLGIQTLLFDPKSNLIETVEAFLK